MSTPELFYESYVHALRDDARAIGGGTRSWAKVVGPMLFPEIEDVDVAARKLDDKLNPNRRERLNDEQERKLMREAVRVRGFSAAVCFVCDDTNHERPKLKAPLDEAAELQRKFLVSIVEQRQILDRFERLTQSPLQAVNNQSR